ncbi:MAG: hypothetical protein ACI4VB_00535 [Bradymonadia bacterium]
MESKFIPTLQVGNGFTYLKLKGILDEDNLLANLLSQIQGRLLLIDMAEIDRINSCGVRDWVNWLNQIQALGVAVILLRCSPSVVSQANMVTNFAADAFIHSFFAPYVHPDTGDEQNVLLFTEDIRQNLPIRAPKIFNENGEELEFDEFEESYFAFVSDPRILNYQVAPDIQAVIQYFLPEAATRQPVIPPRASSAPAQPQVARPSAYPQTSQPRASAPQSAYNQAPQSAYNQAPQSAYNQAPQSAYNQAPQSAYNQAPQSAYGHPVPQPEAAPQNAPYPQPAGQALAPNGASKQAYLEEQPTRAYSQPSPQALMPQPSSSLMRHEQPPLPSTEGAQQAPTAPRPAASQPRQPAPAAPHPQPAPVAPQPRQTHVTSAPVSALPQRKQLILIGGAAIAVILLVILLILILK